MTSNPLLYLGLALVTVPLLLLAARQEDNGPRGRRARARDRKVDAASAESMVASDPPAYTQGIVEAPTRH